MDQPSALKFADKLLDSLVNRRKYVKIDAMRVDLTKMLQENESEDFLKDYELKAEMLEILNEV